MKGKALLQGVVLVVCLLMFSVPNVMAQPAPCIADLNCDGDVAGEDITFFLSELNKRLGISGNPCTGVQTDCPCMAHVPKTGALSVVSYDDGYYQMGVASPEPRFTDNLKKCPAAALSGIRPCFSAMSYSGVLGLGVT